jgi:cyclic pyranopterin phosphate synthase
VNVELTEGDGVVEVSSSVVATESTGVEMEALTACAFAALSILDALTALDPEARMDDLVLLRKEGGKSGSWGRLVEAPTKRRRRRSS